MKVEILPVVNNVVVETTQNKIIIYTSGVMNGTTGGGTWGTITGTLSAQTDLQAALDLKANASDIPTNSDFTLAGLGEKSYNSLDDKPTIPTPIENVIEEVQVDSVALPVTDKTVNITGKQNTLVSGTNIKTINSESLLGSGNIEITGGGSSIELGRNILVESGVPATVELATTDVSKWITVEGDDAEEVTELQINEDTFSANDTIIIRQSSIGFFKITAENVNVVLEGGVLSWGKNTVMQLFFETANRIVIVGGQDE